MAKDTIINSLKFIRLLQKHTNPTHPISQAKLREILGEEEAKEILGDKGTFARRLKEIADYFNKDASGKVLPKDEWRIVYPGYDKEENSKNNIKNGKIYFNPVFSTTELDFFVQQIRKSDNFTDEEKASLEKRLLESLADDYYEYPAKEPTELVQKDNEQIESKLQENIAILRDHIKDKYMVEMVVKNIGSLKPIRVSPYRIVHRDEYYWLIGNCHERKSKTSNKRYYTNEYTFYRIDLIEKIETAHTKEETYIDTTTPKYKDCGKPYTRYSREKRITKARYDEFTQSSIDSEIKKQEFIHGKDFGNKY